MLVGLLTYLLLGVFNEGIRRGNVTIDTSVATQAARHVAPSMSVNLMLLLYLDVGWLTYLLTFGRLQ